LFFFSSRRRHTRSLRDWSSDVCSSDLTCRAPSEIAPRTARCCLDPRMALRVVEVVVFFLLARGRDDHDVGIERGGREIEAGALAGMALELVGVVVLTTRELGVTARQRAPIDGRSALRTECAGR